jgi:hypothetical protein
VRDVYLGALSFEPRATEGFRRWIADPERDSGRASVVVMLDYGGSATSGIEAARLRAHIYDEVISIGAARGLTISKQASLPYSSRSLWAALDELSLSSADRIQLDISCMTRMHAMAAGVYFARHVDDMEWSIGYTTPASYGHLDDSTSSGGWRDTLFIPLGRDASLKNQGMALGLLICGHEAARAAVALEEIEPAAGVIVSVTNRDRPDLHRLSAERNKVVTDHLLSLRMPGPRAASLLKSFTSDGWELETVALETRLKDIAAVVRQIHAGASQIEPPAPIVLFPFGPKNVTFDAAFLLSSWYGTQSWAVCPIHRSHSVDYSDGVDETFITSCSEYRTVLSARKRRGSA